MVTPRCLENAVVEWWAALSTGRAIGRATGRAIDRRAGRATCKREQVPRQVPEPRQVEERKQVLEQRPVEELE